MLKRVLFALCLLICLVNISFAAEAPDLAEGIKLYWEAKYKEAASSLRAVKPEDLSSQERVLLFKFRGLILFARGDKAAAEEAFMEVVKLDPEYKLAEPEFSGDVVKCFRKARTTLSNRISDVGLEQYRAKNKKAAEAAFHQALVIDPSNPMAKDFLPLVVQREEELKPLPPLCKPSLDWGSLDIANGQCSGVDVSSSLHLPVEASKLTLIYAVHHSGVGPCWKIVLYDAQGGIIHTFDDPKKQFRSVKPPQLESRWQVVELPEQQTVAKVVMYSMASPRSKRIVSKDVGNNILDTFLLGLEVVCKPINK
jgi:tetratricopeptide (TPR) repeat protein